MNRRLQWRLRLYRLGRAYERWLRVVMGTGFAGVAVSLGLQRVAPTAGPGWQMLAMGASLVLAGMGHALLGEGSSVAQYATGESEELPAIGKLAGGLLACGGGVLVAVTGLAQVVA